LLPHAAAHARRRDKQHTNRRFQEGSRVQPFQAGLPRIRKRHRRKADIAPHLRHFTDLGTPAQLTQASHAEEPLRLLRNRPIPVNKFRPDRLTLLLAPTGGQLRVDLQPQPLRRHIRLRQERFEGQLNTDVGGFVVAAIDSLAAQLGNRLGDHTHVQVETDTGNMAGLLAAQHIARAANLQILHCHLNAGAEFRVGGERAQAFQRRLRHSLFRTVEEVGVGTLPASPHPAAQLVQLREPEPVRVLHDQGVGVRDIQAGLHDGGTHQHIDLFIPKALDNLFQLCLVHFAVRKGHPRLGNQLLQMRGDTRHIAHPVVYIKHLAVAQQLPANRSHNLLLLMHAHIGEHRVAFLWRCGECGHLPHPGNRHLQSTRNRCG